MRALEGESQNIPIIAVTAHLASDLRTQCLASGMDDVLEKPISSIVLAQRLCRWESFLQGEATRVDVRCKDFVATKIWPECFLCQIDSCLSTLEAQLLAGPSSETSETLETFQSLAFSAGFFAWGGLCATLPRPIQEFDLRPIVTKFRQEWSRLAPTLASGSLEA